MWPAIIGAGASLLGGWIANRGQKSANEANAQNVDKQLDFQREMANTSWQRGTADMTAAGLNPGLAYEKGGAPSPSGAAAHLENQSAGAGASARDAATSFATMAQAKANTRLTNAQANQLEIESVDRAASIANDALYGRINNAFLNNTRTAREGAIFADTGAKEAEMRMKRFESDFTKQRLERENNVLAPLQMDLLRQQIGLASTNARSASAQAALLEYAAPAARRDAAAANTFFGRNIVPYINDAQGVLNLLPFPGKKR